MNYIYGCFIIGFLLCWMLLCLIIDKCERRRKAKKRYNEKIAEIKHEVLFYKNEREIQKGRENDRHGEMICEINL